MISSNFYIVAIGSSAGGMKALREFFTHLGPTEGMAFVIVSHLPNNRETRLHYILQKHTRMKVTLVEKNTRIQPGNIYVLPGNVIATLVDGIVMLRNRLETEKINTAINSFLLSLAIDKRDKAIAIILSGTGTDGATGAKAIHDNGGIVMVQNPSTSDYPSMPLATIKSDHPQSILSPAKLAECFYETIAENSG